MDKAESRPIGLAKYIPILDWLPRYPRGDFRFDLVAGLTASAVVIPQAMAYATPAGLPVEVGLYTALVPMIIYAAQALTAQQIQSFKDFPPRQKPASFNLDSVMEKMQEATDGGLH